MYFYERVHKDPASRNSAMTPLRYPASAAAVAIVARTRGFQSKEADDAASKVATASWFTTASRSVGVVGGVIVVRLRSVLPPHPPAAKLLGGKLWVVADCSVELIIVVVARSLSGRGGPLASAEGTAGNLEARR